MKKNSNAMERILKFNGDPSMKMTIATIMTLALPAIIEVLPGWLVPTRWSDFGFYGRLWDTFCQRWHDLLMLSPTPMDAQRKALFLGLLLSSCISCMLTGELKRAFFLK